MTRPRDRRAPLACLAVALTLLLSACGEPGGGPTPIDPAPTDPYAGGRSYPWSDVPATPSAVPVGLHDLASAPYISASNSWGPLEKNRSNGSQLAADGTTLTIGGTTFSSGLGLHAQGELRYRLEGRCTTFTAQVGVDDEVGNRGSVVFQVFGDGRERYDSGVRTGSQGAATVSVDLKGVNELRLIVTDGGDGIAYDHADWAGATLDCRAVSPPPAPTVYTYAAIAPQPANVSEAQGEAIGGRLYVFGGFDSKRNCCTSTNRAQLYDPATNAWTPLRAMPGTGATHAGMTNDGSRIYYAGGYVGRLASDGTWSGQVFGTQDVWAYDPASGTYAALPKLPVPSAAGQLEYLSGRLHYFGGTNPARTQDLGDHYVLDLAAGATSWTSAAPLPQPRHHMGSAALGGKLYAIGGQEGHDAQLVTQAAVHVYDPATNSWSALAPLPRARSHIGNSTFVLGGRIVVAGGETSHDVPMSDVTAYDPATNRWTALSALPAARASAVAAPLGTGFVFTGGTSTAGGWKAMPGN